MKPDILIDQLLLGRDLKTFEAQLFFRQILRFQKKSNSLDMLLLVLLRKKGEAGSEIVGLLRAVRQVEGKSHRMVFKRPSLVDGCGTGGDGTHSFNISTLASLVAAGAGAFVAKHGNRGISSRCGSSDLMEALGVKIDASPQVMLRALNKCRMGYFHAPQYHPSFRIVQPLRRQLASQYHLKTIFNVIGPLVNPLNPQRQAVGVFTQDLLPVLAEVMKELKYKRALIFWSTEGMDELTTSRKSLIYELRDGRIKKYQLNPRKLGLRAGSRRYLRGGSVDFNRKIALTLLNDKKSAPASRTRRDAVILNAAAILSASGLAPNLRSGLKLATAALRNGKAFNVLRQLIRISHGH